MTAPSPQAQSQPAQDVSIPKPGLPPLNRMPRLTSIRSWSTPDYVRVAIDLEQEVKYQAGRVPRPDRIFFDLYGVKLASDLVGKTFDVETGFLHKIRVSQYNANMARVVLDVDDVAEYSAFLLPNPYRLIIDIHGKMPARQVASANPNNATDNPDTSRPSGIQHRTLLKISRIPGPLYKMPCKAGPTTGLQVMPPIAQPITHPLEPDVTVTNIRPNSNGTKATDNAASALQRAEEAKAGPLKNAPGARSQASPSANTQTSAAHPPSLSRQPILIWPGPMLRRLWSMTRLISRIRHPPSRPRKSRAARPIRRLRRNSPAATRRTKSSLIQPPVKLPRLPPPRTPRLPRRTVSVL